MSNTTIRPLEAHEGSAISRSLFLTADWEAMYDGRMRRHGVFEGGEEPLAVFTLYTGKKLGAKFAITAPLTPHCGLMIEGRSTKLSSKQSLEKKVHTAIADYLDGLDVSLVDINLPHQIQDTQAYVWGDFDVSPRVTYLLDISVSTDLLFSSMTASKRQVIRKAEKDALKVEMSMDVDRIMGVVHKTFGAKGEGFEEDVLRRILSSDTLADRRYAFITEIEGRPSALVLVVHDSDAAYYLIGGYDRDNSHEGAGSLAMWRAIQEAQSRGLKTFDFLGSMIPEVERYIRGFGGKLTNFHSVSKRSMLADAFMKVTGKG